MKTNITLTSLITIIVISSFGFISLKKDNYSAQLELKITCEQTELSISQKERAKTKATIFNGNDTPVKIILPGDGSMDGWRTPIIVWSIVDLNKGQEHPKDFPRIPRRMRCGNVNGLSMDQVLSLEPNTSYEFDGWGGFPNIPMRVGEYSAKYYYKHDPNVEWKGHGGNHPDALKIIEAETEFFILSSNEIIFKVVE